VVDIVFQCGKFLQTLFPQKISPRISFYKFSHLGEENTMKPIYPKSILSVLMLISLLITLLGSVAFPANAHAAAIWYVATEGNDSNTCSDIGTPCLTINAAISKAASGDMIEVAAGTYTGSGTEVVLIDKSVTLSGGWDSNFAVQDGKSIIDGQGTSRGITVNSSVSAVVDHFTVQHGYGGQGGGIYNSGTLTVGDSVINNNASGWMGGGIFNLGMLTINNTTISGNSIGKVGTSGGGGGGGIQDYHGTTVLNNSTVSNNFIVGWYSGSGINAFGTVTLNNSTVSGNTGGDGTGIFTFTGAVILNNSTISGNQSYGFTNHASTITLQNTIIAGNGTKGDCYNDLDGYNGTVTSQGYNLIGNSDGCSFTPTTGDLVGISANPINPRLGLLQDNGGPTWTQALLFGSPALDAGNPAAPGSGGNACLATDQRGVIRPAGNACEIGAYEAVLPIVAAVKRATSSPTGASNVDFIVTFSEAVTGVNTSAPFSDFTLTTTGITGAAITAVTGSGNTYTVSVNTGSGNGTIRLDVLDDDSIQNVAGKPIGGIGAGNGIFTSGEVYTILGPHVSSVILVNPGSSSAPSVDFTVTFSEAVTGVDIGAPFNDFSLTTTGITSASISAVTGFNDTYTVSVNTGFGTGAIRLDILDDDSIQNVSGKPLGGSGAGNGNFTSGEQYTLVRIPTPLAPENTVNDPTPTYKWTKIPGATKYQYQVIKGTKTIYTKTVAATACRGLTCSNTPTTVLKDGIYKWRVMALVSNVWQGYSDYKEFIVKVPKPGYWSGAGIDFYVTKQGMVDKFSVYVYVGGCGNYKITYTRPLTIEKSRFSFKGSFNASGVFSSLTKASGRLGFRSYFLPGCGSITGGPFSWKSAWRNSTQPLLVKTIGLEPILVAPVPEAQGDFITIEPVAP